MFKNHTDCALNDEIILKSQQRFKSDYHKVHTEQINNIALISNDDKRLQTFDKITTFPYGTNAFKVCESEMLSKYKLSILMIMQMEKKKKKFKVVIYSRSSIPKILIIVGSKSGKRHAVPNLINNQPDIDEMYLYPKDPYEVK